ncbi:antiterminator LoaP [Paenibacillus sp. 2TAF8]|uniref:antiterminator LoaP n=1 Tax=Paenibacillus sp. 2TAF8 TaxID=3233020 RepID=UPI003F96226D
MNWYAIYVQSGRESQIKSIIEKRFDSNELQCLLPKRKVPERREGKVTHVVKLMFPGYLFLHTVMNAKRYYEIREIPNVYRLLRYTYNESSSNQEEYFQTICPQEIKVIMRLLNENEIIEYSQVDCSNTNVKVFSGPLKGLEDIIQKVDKRKKRAKIQISLLDEKKIIEVGLEIL